MKFEAKINERRKLCIYEWNASAATEEMAKTAESKEKERKKEGRETVEK